jgi:hypothetical protein
MRGIATMIGVLCFTCNGATTEPRDYGSYDAFGMLPFEAVKKPSATVAKALAEEKRGRYESAAQLYWSAVLENRSDTQAIVGLAESARRVSTPYARKFRDALAKDERFAVASIPAKDWPTMLLRGLLSWGTSDRDRTFMSIDLTLAHRWNRDDFSAFMVLWALGEVSTSEARSTFDSLHNKYPKVDGFDYYRILSYATGNLGTFEQNPKTGKWESTGSASDAPKYSKAIALLGPYLGDANPPTWVHYVAVIAYNGIGQKDAARKHAKLVLAAQGESRLLKDWKKRVAPLAK